jgi:hypothetical protein
MQLVGELPYLLFGESDFFEGASYAKFVSCAGTRAVIMGVIGVGAIKDCVEMMLLCNQKDFMK